MYSQATSKKEGERAEGGRNKKRSKDTIKYWYKEEEEWEQDKDGHNDKDKDKEE